MTLPSSDLKLVNRPEPSETTPAGLFQEDDDRRAYFHKSNPGWGWIAEYLVK
jgi:hypothetical protein